MRERPCVLIVDDHPPSVDSLKSTLTEKNTTWEILPAYTMKEAIAIINHRALDAVVTDWKLNDRDETETGFVVIEEARRKDPLCVTILVTAFPEEFERYRDAFPRGIYDCILKTQRGIVVADEIEFKLKKALQARWDHAAAYFYARHIDHSLREQLGTTSKQSKLNRRWLTTVFTDVRGFTKVSDQLRAYNEPLAIFLQELYGAITKCTHKNGGIVDKFMGDGSMLLFGVFDRDASDRNCKHAQSAVRAALEMQEVCNPIIETFRKNASKWHPAKIGGLSLGIGINSGEVLVGLIRTEHRDQFTALGHAVNLAQRYESKAGKDSGDGHPYGRILITSTVVSRLENHFLLRKEPDLKDLRNIEETHEVWSVHGECAK
jgi:class 3 adenylate cyclase/ActR/RegA family two-component response regulator